MSRSSFGPALARPVRRAARALTALAPTEWALTATVGTLAALAIVLAVGLASPAHAAPATVTAENRSTPTACAEEDNVSFVLRGDGIRRLRVQALQPPYLAAIAGDRTAPDFSGCNFNGGTHPTDPRYAFTPRRRVLYDSARWRIVGVTFASFWRPQRVPVQVAGRPADTGGFHLLQLLRKRGRGPAREVLVLYPADGYWRAKPMPMPRFGDGAYGSSFLLGPIEQAGRPVVDIASIRIAPQPMALQLRFAEGGQMRVRLAQADRTRTVLDVAFTPPTPAWRAGDSPGEPPFAMLRSMYVAPDNADASEVQWRAAPGAPLQSLLLPQVHRLQAAQLRFGRTQVSRHNSSAPDMVFDRFDTQARGAR